MSAGDPEKPKRGRPPAASASAMRLELVRALIPHHYTRPPERLCAYAAALAAYVETGDVPAEHGEPL